MATKDETRANRVEELERELARCRGELAVVSDHERRYRLVFDNMLEGFGLGVLLLDEQQRPRDARLLEVNQAFGSLTGLSPEQAVGRTVRELIPGTEQHWFDAVGRAVLSGEPMRFENYAEALGKWFNVFVYRTESEQFAFLFIDITERKAEEEAVNARFELAEAVFTHSVSALAVLDPDYNFLRVNEAYARAANRDVSDFDGRNHFDLYPSDARSIFDEAVRTGRTYRAVSQPFVFPDQPERGVTYWDWSLAPVFDQNGDIDSLVLSLIDVTEHQVAEQALRESRARYHQQAMELELIYRTAPIGLCVVDTELRFVHVNDRLAEINRLPVQEHQGKTVREVAPAGVGNQAEPLLRRVLETGEPVLGIETSSEVSPGEYRYWLNQFWPLTTDDGTVFGVNVVVEDVTEHRWLEESREREREFRRLAENSTDIISRYDRNLRRTYVNRAIEFFIRGPREELIGKTPQETGILPTRFAEETARKIREVFTTGKPQEMEAVVPTLAGDMHIEARGIPEFGPDGEVESVLTITRDITERKRAEQALRASEERYRRLVENLNEGIWLLDEKDETTFVNERMAAMLGYSTEEMLGSSLFNFMDREAADAAAGNLARGRGGQAAEYDFQFRCKNGAPIWTHLVTTPLFDEQDRYQGALAGVLDITERKRAEQALHHSKQEFEALAERAPDIITRVDRNKRLRYINRAFERLTGQRREQVIGTTAAERGLSPEEVALREQTLGEVIETGRELVVEHKNPSLSGERDFQARLVPEFDPNGRVESVLVVDRDITELKKAQHELEELSLQDHLTGIANRRYLDRIVAREWRQEARYRHPVALIMADLDYFKAYNDHYGHQQGDRCLQEVAAALGEPLHRPTDTLVRYGGEEFVAVLPETDLAAAEDMAQRLKRAVERIALPHAASPVADRVTVSMGVTAKRADEVSFDQLIAAADDALYRAKEKGRNRIEANP